MGSSRSIWRRQGARAESSSLRTGNIDQRALQQLDQGFLSLHSLSTPGSPCLRGTLCVQVWTCPAQQLHALCPAKRGSTPDPLPVGQGGNTDSESAAEGGCPERQRSDPALVLWLLHLHAAPRPAALPPFPHIWEDENSLSEAEGVLWQTLGLLRISSLQKLLT